MFDASLLPWQMHLALPCLALFSFPLQPFGLMAEALIPKVLFNVNASWMWTNLFLFCIQLFLVVEGRCIVLQSPSLEVGIT